MNKNKKKRKGERRCIMEFSVSEYLGFTDEEITETSQEDGKILVLEE